MAEVTEWDSGKLKRLTLGPALGELDAPDGAMRLRVLLLDGDFDANRNRCSPRRSNGVWQRDLVRLTHGVTPPFVSRFHGTAGFGGP